MCGFARAEEGRAHAAKEAWRAGLGLAHDAELLFELAGIGVVLFERLVLDQHGLHQRVGPIGGFLKTLIDGLDRLGVAFGVFEFGELLEQFDNEFAFFRGHWRLRCSCNDSSHVGRPCGGGMTGRTKFRAGGGGSAADLGESGLCPRLQRGDL